MGLHFLSFWPLEPSQRGTWPGSGPKLLFPFKLCNFSFSKFCLLRLYFLSFWPFGLAFLSFWPFGLSFPFSFCSDGPGPSSELIPFILAFWAFISFHFGLLDVNSFDFGLLGLSFWPFRASFPFMLAFWGFISFHFGIWSLPKGAPGQDLAQNCYFPFKLCNFSFSKICLLVLHFLSFWPFGPSFPFILASRAFPKGHLARNWSKIVISPLNCVIFPFPKFAFWNFIFFILAFWALLSFRFGLLGLHFLSFWAFEPSFPFILAFCALISFHLCLLGIGLLALSPLRHACGGGQTASPTTLG